MNQSGEPSGSNEVNKAVKVRRRTDWPPGHDWGINLATAAVCGVGEGGEEEEEEQACCD